MADRAVLVTGASSGIGLAIARALAEEGHGVTLSARRPEKLGEAAKGLSDAGLDVQGVPADMSEEDGIKSLAAADQDHYGRLDVLVNNAGIGIGGEIADAETKKARPPARRQPARRLPHVARGHPGASRGRPRVRQGADPQHLVDRRKVRSALACRLLRDKAAVVGLTQAMQGELSNDGVEVTAFCPGFVATAMSEWVDLPRDELIQPADIAEAVRFLLKTSPACIVPEIQFVRPNDRM